MAHKKKVIKLVNNQQIGDCIKTTTVAKLFKKQYPQYDIEVNMSHPSVYYNNPNVKNPEPVQKVKIANVDELEELVPEQDKLYVETRQDDEDGKVDNPYSIHKLRVNKASFLDGMVGYINAKYGFNLQVTQQEPDLYLSEEEKKPFPDLPEKYWVIKAGGEKTNTRKHYPYEYWREIVKALPEITFVQEGVSKDDHKYLEFPNVINGIDKYDVRSTIRLIYHSQGVVCPITFSGHVAAAFHKPAVIIAGGGEDVSWENYKYDDFHYVHTIGSFECCQYGGCWKAECTNKDTYGDNKCMKLITPDIIIDIIKKYGDTR